MLIYRNLQPIFIFVYLKTTEDVCGVTIWLVFDERSHTNSDWYKENVKIQR